MVKYKVNLKFKNDGKSLNEIITNVLKIELENFFYSNGTIEVPLKVTQYSQNERSIKQ